METQSKERYQRLLNAIEAERAEEERYYEQLSLDTDIKEKIANGILWYPVEIVKRHYTIGEYVEIVVERTKHVEESHKFKAGVGCVIYQIVEDRVDYRGTISFVKRNKMGILLHTEVIEKYELKDKGLLGVELIYDERPYQVMKDAIHKVMNHQDQRIRELRDGITNRDAFQYSQLQYENIFVPPHLNESQQTAIQAMANSGQLGIIHGPPGTGKTTTLVALITSLLQYEKRILVCAPSNNAVDLLASKLDESGINVTRIGNVTRIADHLSHVTLAEKLRNHDDWQHIKKVKIEAQLARKQAATYKRKFGAQERADRNAMYRESRELRKWARDLEDRLVQDLLHQSQVIATTLIGADYPLINDMHFDTLIIDEASQALESECWVAMLKANRTIMAGDHKQLPPTVKSSKAIELGLETTLLDQLSGVLYYSYTLRTQYRMNDAILSFSNTKFYEGVLQSAPHVKNRKLNPDDDILTWIDTSGCGYEEHTSAQHNSKWNEGEYFILREHMLAHMEHYHDVSIGVISPYAEQVRYIKSQLPEDADLSNLDIEINSIDGFQGQEKDVIYISLVRSNDNGEIGFLKDLRRLNVALTRTKLKLVIIGDVATLSSNKTYMELLDLIEKHGKYQSAWEYMSS